MSWTINRRIDSPQVIANLELSYLELNVIREPDNLGQSAACVDGFHKSRGQYVVFVDADDYYFETFAETHFLVHLTLPNAVGFTSSEMMQVVGDSVVLGNVMTASGTPFRSQCHVVEIDKSLALAKAQEVGLCRPGTLENLPLRGVRREAIEWVWSPTSGNFYRRDALALFVDCAQLRTLRCATDAFFNFAINAFTGSVLIDKPLGAYRIHGDNLFAQHAALNNMCHFPIEMDEGSLAAKMALAHVIANAQRFADKCLYIRTFPQSLSILGRKAAQERSKHGLARNLRKFSLSLIKLYWQIKLRSV